MRVGFAEAAAGFKSWMEKLNKEIAHLEGSLEDQFKTLKEKRAEKSATGTEKFEAAKAAHEKLAEAGITDNKHTALTLPQLKLEWEGKSKKQMTNYFSKHI